MLYKGKILQTGKTSAGIIISDEFVERLGGGRKPKVKVKFNDYEYRGSIAFMHGKFWLSVTNETRDKSGVKVDEEVEIDIEPDTAPRTVDVPADFQAALDNNSEAKTAFEKLSYSHKRAHVLPIEAAKKAETRARRIEKSIEMLSQ